MRNVLPAGRRPAFMLLVFCLGSFGLFYRNLGRTFAADDFQVMSRIGLGRDFRTPGFFRPMSDLTLYFNFLIGGLNPAGYYLFNILVHGVNCFLLYLFCLRWRWTGNAELQRRYAAIAAFFFLVYPFHSEAIDWILGRGASLCTMFVLAALVTVTGSLSARAKFIRAALFYFLGMAAYEPAILLPFYCLAVMIVQGVGRRTLWRWLSGFGVVLAVHLAIRLLVSGWPLSSYPAGLLGSLMKRMGGNAMRVAGRLFLPPTDHTNVLIGLSLVVVMVLLVLAGRFYGRSGQQSVERRYFVALLLMLILSCAWPALASVSTRTSETDRLLYIPSLFWCCMVSLLLVFLVREKRKQLGLASLLVAAMIFFLERTNENWLVASRVTRQILEIAKRRQAGSNLYLVNLPDEYNGAFIFRLGFPEALERAGGDPSRVVVVNHLTRDEAIVLPEILAIRDSGEERILPPSVHVRRMDGDPLLVREAGSSKGPDDGRAEWRVRPDDTVYFWNNWELISLGSGRHICPGCRTQD